jgi:C-terminal processing protease CtpA/Prc
MQSYVLYNKEYKPGYIHIKYSRNQIAEDIDFMLRITKKIHPKFYHNFTSHELKIKVDSSIKSMPDSVNIFEASLVLGEIAAMFNEGHLGLVSNSELDKFYQSLSQKFPYYAFTINNAGFVIYKDLSDKPQLAPLDTIIAINNIPVAELNQKFRKYFGGMEEWRQRLIRSQFDNLLFRNGIYPPYTIKARKNGSTIEFVTDGSILREQKTQQQKGPNYEYSVLDKDIAYINFYNMGNYMVFKDSIKLTFEDIASRQINKLIVDLRYNLGGNSKLGEHLLTYLTDKPYRLVGPVKIKMSRQAKHYQGKFNPFYYKVIPNGIVWRTGPKPHSRPVSQPFYKGVVVFLIGSGTFSSANMFANGIKDFKLAPTIGQSTAESCSEYSDMISFMLPHTQLVAKSPCKIFVRANGDKNDTKGVEPDIIVLPDPKDIIIDRDTVLEFAKKYLKSAL